MFCLCVKANVICITNLNMFPCPALYGNHFPPSCHASLATDIFLISTLYFLFVGGFSLVDWLPGYFSSAWTLPVSLMNRSSVAAFEKSLNCIYVWMTNVWRITKASQTTKPNQTKPREYLFASEWHAMNFK